MKGKREYEKGVRKWHERTRVFQQRACIHVYNPAVKNNEGNKRVQKWRESGAEGRAYTGKLLVYRYTCIHVYNLADKKIMKGKREYEKGTKVARKHAHILAKCLYTSILVYMYTSIQQKFGFVKWNFLRGRFFGVRRWLFSWLPFGEGRGCLSARGTVFFSEWLAFWRG